MRPYSSILFAMIIMPLFLGCATSKDMDNIERQMASMNAGLREAKGNLDDINFNLQAQSKRSKEALESIKAIEEKQVAISDRLKGLSDELAVIKQNQADLGSRVFTMGGGEAKGMGGQIDELAHDIQTANAKLDALKAALMQRLEALEKEPQGKEAAAPAQGQQARPAERPSATAAGDPTQMYQGAKLDYTKGSYELAILGFREYLRSFPDGEYAGNSQYWIGESLYSLGKYEEALPEFEKVIKGYPGGNKVPDAMLKKGYCHDALKRPNEARVEYEELVRKFPGSDAAKLAEEKLKKK